MDIPDGDLVRLARDGDPAAFRLLVERHRPMARARAARLCPQPDDAADAVQDAFLQAFLALDRLRDPDRFAGWLGGIVANVCRAQRRRPPLTLLGDWPEHLHPASAGTQPSAEDLDRADVLGRAVAGLPPGQRHAVTAFYYADQPAGQIAATAGAAKASLHKARRRLREYITAHRPDLIPATSRRIPMTAVRIAHADPWPGRTPDGGMEIRHVLVILADDAGHRALPVRLPPEQLWRQLSRPDDFHEEDSMGDDHAEEMTGRLLQAAGVTLTGVTVTDLGPGVTVTRMGIAGPGGTRPVTASLADGLTLAVITGAPLAVDDPVMDRLARPVTGPDLLSQFRSQQTPSRSLSREFEPRQHGVHRRPGPMAAPRHLPAPGHRAPLFLCHRGRAGDPGRGRPRAGRIRLPRPGHRRRRLPRPHRHLPRRTALHRHGGRPRRAGTPRPQPGPARATAGGEPRSLGRPGQPHRLRHRDRRVDPV
jgi:RNA polymerase sigma-70 factor (ECF subfamily)